MIRSLKVTGLNGRFNYDFLFSEDFNIFTGQIGTGKTTLLKLIWFLTSGNLHRVISEIPFQSVLIKTSQFSLSMSYMNQGNPDQVKLVCKFDGSPKETEILLPLKRVSSETMISMALQKEDSVRKLNEKIATVTKSSQFFPTFRRIERHNWVSLGDSIAQLASELSVHNHNFVSAVSTYDIVELLTKKSIEISKGRNRVDEEYTTLCDRWKQLEEIIREIFSTYYGSILITDSLVLPCDSNREEISASRLSSGEKQLLGLLCWNAFGEANAIFIDEPELSMHLDWQRLLLRLLSYQGTEKQFFVATHSILIADKYKDREFKLIRRDLEENI